MSKNVFDIGQELMSNAYPGRGIILGRTPDNKKNGRPHSCRPF